MVADRNHVALPSNAKEKLNTIVLEESLYPHLEDESFTSGSTYDAINRPIQLIFPHSNKERTKINVTQPIYNEANLLGRLYAWLRLDTEPVGLDPSTATEQFVRDIDYNAKGQRELIEYGNDVTTSFEYDPLTFRLKHMRIVLVSNEKLQDLFTFMIRPATLSQYVRALNRLFSLVAISVMLVYKHSKNLPTSSLM